MRVNSPAKQWVIAELAKIPYDFARDPRSLEALFEENKQKKAKMIELLEESLCTQKCKRCKLSFNEILNKQRPECRYHQGTKKFFSCKDCGQDEYFSCCGKCNICEQGCMTTYHV